MECNLVKYFLRIEMQQDEDEIFISKSKYTKKILEKFVVEELRTGRHNCWMWSQISKGKWREAGELDLF